MSKSELTVYLLRHGQTDMNADSNKYCGLTDAKLTELGKQQANHAGKLVASINFDAVYASPLQRAKDTAELLGISDTIKVDPRLIEIDFGRWEGKTREEFVAENPDSWEKWNEDPKKYAAGGNGETAQSVIERLDDFYAEKIKEHKHKNILIVGHNGINRIYLAHKLGMPLQNYRSILQENSCITLFTMGGPEGFQLQRLNCGGTGK